MSSNLNLINNEKGKINKRENSVENEKLSYALAIKHIVQLQHEFFQSNATIDISFRIDQLKKLKMLIQMHEDEILHALKADMNKPEFESYTSEIANLYEEIDLALKNIKIWSKTKRVSTPLLYFLSSSFIYQEPMGVVLIIGTWNYPFQLTIAPLISAISAGNCVTLKTSDISVNTSHLIANMIKDNFEPQYISVIEGGRDATQALLKQPFDHIFYTGGTEVGKIVMKAASENLVPVTLELGGKSPCIVDKDIDIKQTARRIVWGKFFNAGQTCIAPDYLLVHSSIKSVLLDEMKKAVTEFFGDEPEKSPDYARIVSDKHFLRLKELLLEGNIFIGGTTIEKERYIAPTIIENISINNKIMEDEIFGPILPVLEYTSLNQVFEIVKNKSNPLALYLFTKNTSIQKKIIQGIPFGGGSINDTILQFGNIKLPFGGRGNSGMGHYHGEFGFKTFSHSKSVIKRSFLGDIPLRFPPYKVGIKALKWMMKLGNIHLP